jgi:Mce-associated membrane protein
MCAEEDASNSQRVIVMDKNGKDTDTVITTSAAEPETDHDTTDFDTEGNTEVSKAADKSIDSTAADDSGADNAPPATVAKGRRISLSVRALVVGTFFVGLIVALGVMTWLYLGDQTRLETQARQAANTKRAEQIALDYAVNAAIMDYKDLGPWKQNLVKGTTPELNDKLTKAGDAMEQILLPLQWSSGARPLAAKVRSSDNGVYVVDAFVSVTTKTVQAADGLQSTATYSVTIDSNNAWKISDVGGIAAVVDSK